MIRLITAVNPDFLFALAGQPAVERHLLRTLPETGAVRLRVVIEKGAPQTERFAACYDDLIRAGLIEVAVCERLSDALLDGVDGIMLHGLPGSLAWLYANGWANRRPFFIHLHSLELTAAVRAGFRYALFDWRRRHAGLFVAPSRATAQRILSVADHPDLQWYGAPPAVVVPHGIDPDAVRGGSRAAGRARLNLPERAQVVLGLGRLSPQKGDCAGLVLAFARLLARGDAAGDRHLVLAGSVGNQDGAYAESVRLLVARLGLEERVHFCIHVSEEEKRDLLAAGDVFVSLATSPQESFGISLVEAMAAGLPVVATDWNGYPEVVSPAARRWLVPTVASHDLARRIEWAPGGDMLVDACAFDLPALVTALHTLLDDPAEAARVRDDGLRHAGAYTWPAVARQLVGLWKVALRADREALRPHYVPRPSPRESFVDGLATRYLGPSTAVHATGALVAEAGSTWQPRPWCDDGLALVPALIEACTPAPRTLAALGADLGLSVSALHALVLFLLRRGVLALDG